MEGEVIKVEKEKKSVKTKQNRLKQSCVNDMRSRVRLQISDTDHGKEILSESGEIYFQGTSTRQATLEWKEPPRRALLLMKVRSMEGRCAFIASTLLFF